MKEAPCVQFLFALHTSSLLLDESCVNRFELSILYVGVSIALGSGLPGLLVFQGRSRSLRQLFIQSEF